MPRCCRAPPRSSRCPRTARPRRRPARRTPHRPPSSARSPRPGRRRAPRPFRRRSRPRRCWPWRARP
ncbi:hypothetical protein GB931_01205 [Modestobacter sp. I12A-02628]|nr:hypothetical protein [Goekera deserti]